MESQVDINPLVSIIMPTYNRANYIEETIESIQVQTYTNWELIILDDGSEDETENVVKAIKDNRISYINNGRVGIVGQLKNEGLMLSKGAYIAFMDSDDLWPKKKLAKQIEALNKNQEAQFSYTNYCDFKEMPFLKEPMYRASDKVNTKYVFKEYAKGILPISITTVLFRRVCLEQIGNFNVDRIFTDYSFIGKLAYHYKAIVFHEPLLYRRLHESNNTSVNWKYDFEEYQETVKAYINEKWIAANDVYPSLFLSYINLGEKFLKESQYKLAINNYIKSWRYRPISIIPAKKVLKAVLLYCRFL